MEIPKLKLYLKYILLNILVAALISMLLINYVASAYRIEGNSMFGTLRDGERVIITKTAIHEESINRFDVLIFQKPDEPGKRIIKRVIGLPGEVIHIEEGDLFIDSLKLEQPFLGPYSGTGDLSPAKPPITIPKGCYFMMGDNRLSSMDSRHFGTVPIENILGKAIIRYWPLSRFGLIK